MLPSPDRNPLSSQSRCPLWAARTPVAWARVDGAPGRGEGRGARPELLRAGRAAQAPPGSDPCSLHPDESSEDEGEDKLEDEQDEAGGYRLGARERALSPGLEESGLGLLARFAASALPSPTVGPALSVVQLEAKQKARKKEERQSLMGKWGRCCQSGRVPSLQVRRQRPRGGQGRAGSPQGPSAGRPCPEQRLVT